MDKKLCLICGSTDITALELNGLPLFRCSSCGLAWRRTFDIPLSHYAQTDPRSSAERTDARLRNAKDRVETFFCAIPKTAVCDIGTGEGAFLVALRENDGDGVGIEPGKRYRAEAVSMGVRIVGETYEDAPRVARQEQIQTFTLFHVIEHLERPDRVLQLLYDSLPQGGHLVIETPNLLSPVLRARNYRDPLIYPEHLFYFNEDNLARLLKRLGFSIQASGRRDFDQYQMPIRASLWRLLWVAKETPQALVPARWSGGVRERVRLFLARQVVRTGRLSYMWYIVVKP